MKDDIQMEVSYLLNRLILTPISSFIPSTLPCTTDKFYFPPPPVLYQCPFHSILIYHNAPMGIEGLLKFLDPIVIKQHISTFQSKTVAIDMMSWLYKGCYRCAFELNQNIDTNDFLYYIFEMIDLLFYYKIKPICVFDGRYVGKKEDTLEKRKKSKEENRQKGMDYLKIGNQEEAKKYLSRCIIIDQRIITTTMRALHTKGIDFMVAPYESDSQIAKLINLGLADIAITEDSDLVVYGVKVILKLNQDGECDYVDLNKWKPQDVDSLFLKQFLKLDYVGRLQSAILSGSDYNHSVKGIGIKRAIKHISKLKTMNKVIEHLRELKNYSDKVPEDYEKTVLESKLIFLFATTYNPFTMSLEYLSEERLKEFLEGMSEEQLQAIVGKRFEYNEEICKGKVNVKNFNKRDIYPIDIKTIFAINASNLQVKEVANYQRRMEEAAARKQREEELKIMAENGNVDNLSYTQHKKKKVVAPVVQLTEEEKKKQSQERKAERVKRFNDFKNLLNNYIMDSDVQSQNEDSISSESQSPEPAQEENTKQKPTANKQPINKQEELQEEAQVETFSDSESIDGLQFLNPWLKR